MFSLDMRTALFSFLLISLMSTLLSALLTKQFSKRYNGIYHLFWGFFLQPISLLLILCRGMISDWLSIDLANFLNIGGIILLLLGIEKYTGNKSSLKKNLLLLVIFITVHSWFTFVSPDLPIRHLNVSVTWLLLFSQSSILLLRLRGSGFNRILPVTIVSIAFCVVCCLRIIKFFTWGHSDDYFNSDLFDIIIIIISQVFLIILMFSLAYMFGGRLFDDIKSEEVKFSRIFHTAPYSILLSRLSDGRIIEANRVFNETTGYSYHEVIGRTTLELGIWPETEDRTNLVSELMKHEKVSGKEILIGTKSGQTIPGLLNSELLLINNEMCIFSSFEDITERKKAEKKLHEASAYTRNLIEASLDPFMTISYDGKIMDVNISAERVTGKCRAELMGSNFKDYFTEPEKAENGYLEAFSKGLVRDYPLHIKHPEGTSQPVLFNATVYRNEAGEINGVFAIARDITEILKTEEDLRRSKEMLEKLNQHIVDVRENERKNIAMALHDDLGQMLTGLCLDIAWLKKKLSGQPEVIIKKIDQLNETLTDTIDSVKETSSFLRPVMLFELGLVPAIVTHLRKTGEQSGIDFTFIYDSNGGVPNDDISLVVYRIMQEAVTNIVRHSRSQKADVSLNISTKNILLTVQDFGKGITGEKVNSLSSMGIAGMRERIRSVNGKIYIQGEKGKGTLISVSIPNNTNYYDKNINN